MEPQPKGLSPHRCVRPCSCRTRWTSQSATWTAHPSSSRGCWPSWTPGASPALTSGSLPGELHGPQGRGEARRAAGPWGSRHTPSPPSPTCVPASQQGACFWSQGPDSGSHGQRDLTALSQKSFSPGALRSHSPEAAPLIQALAPSFLPHLINLSSAGSYREKAACQQGACVCVCAHVHTYE